MVVYVTARSSLLIWVLAVAVAVGACSSPSKMVTPLAHELGTLRAGNGLYESPRVADLVETDLQASAYGLSVLKLAGGTPASPWSDPDARDAAGTALAANSVWAQWYIRQISDATGSSSPAPQNAILASFNRGGYFDDKPAAPPDNASRLAATAAALHVASAAGIAVPRAERGALIRWLRTRSHAAANPYQLCNALSGLQDLHALPAVSAAPLGLIRAWWSAHVTAGLHSPEDSLDLFGYSCTEHLLGGLDPKRSADIERLTKPYLSYQAEPAIAFNLAQTWVLSGGPPAALAGLATQMRDRIVVPTHLLGKAISKLGTLQNSYSVTEIRRAAGLPRADAKMAAAVRTMLGSGPPDPTGLNTLIAAATLRGAAAADASLEKAAISQVLRNAPTVVDPSNVGVWAEMLPTLAYLHQMTLPQLTLSHWGANTELGRYEAWLALGLDHGAIGTAAAAEFAALLNETPTLLLHNASTLSMKELAASVLSLFANGRSSRVPWPQVRSALAGLKGCGTFKELYRPSGTATGCDLQASAAGYQLAALVSQHPQVTPS